MRTYFTHLMFSYLLVYTYMLDTVHMQRSLNYIKV